MIQPLDIFIYYVSWDNTGKRRPVLAYLINIDKIVVFPITTQYENKSETIRAKYFKVKDLAQSGLDRQSYIDTGTKYILPSSVVDKKNPIGKLSEDDAKRFKEFISQPPA